MFKKKPEDTWVWILKPEHCPSGEAWSKDSSQSKKKLRGTEGGTLAASAVLYVTLMENQEYHTNIYLHPPNSQGLRFICLENSMTTPHFYY